MHRFLCSAEIGVKRLSFKMKGMLGLIASASLKASQAAQWFSVSGKSRQTNAGTISSTLDIIRYGGKRPKRLFFRSRLPSS
jgi:hypothetical protein